MDVVSRWQVEPHHIRLLTLAVESWDRGDEARKTRLEGYGALFNTETLIHEARGPVSRAHHAGRVCDLRPQG